MFLHSFQMRGRCCRTGTGPVQHHQLGREPRLLAQGLTERPHWTLSPWDLLFSEAHPFFRGVSPRGALFPRGGGCRAPADSGLSNLFRGGTSLKPVYYGRHSGGFGWPFRFFCLGFLVSKVVLFPCPLSTWNSSSPVSPQHTCSARSSRGPSGSQVLTAPHPGETYSCRRMSQIFTRSSNDTRSSGSPQENRLRYRRRTPKDKISNCDLSDLWQLARKISIVMKWSPSAPRTPFIHSQARPFVSSDLLSNGTSGKASLRAPFKRQRIAGVPASHLPFLHRT